MGKTITCDSPVLGREFLEFLLSEDTTLWRDFLCNHTHIIQLQQTINYQFNDILKLVRALTHKSLSYEFSNLYFKNYEKLEFLGDSVLQLSITERLFCDFETLSEGELSKFRSSLVNEDSLTKLAHAIGVEKCLLLGKGELSLCEKGVRSSLKADVLEALLGAVYLDGGHESARAVLERMIEIYEQSTGAKFIDQNNLAIFDAKSRLQELTMSQLGELPTYEATSDGETFHVELVLKGKVVHSTSGESKKKCQRNLAKWALENNIVEQILRGE
jgi:ribonuclease-3